MRSIYRWKLYQTGEHHLKRVIQAACCSTVTVLWHESTLLSDLRPEYDVWINLTASASETDYYIKFNFGPKWVMSHTHDQIHNPKLCIAHTYDRAPLKGDARWQLGADSDMFVSCRLSASIFRLGIFDWKNISSIRLTSKRLRLLRTRVLY